MGERWIVDGMNVIGSRPDGWWRNRDAAMRAFVRVVDDHARAAGKDITVVFDSDPGPLPARTHIEVVIARQRGPNAADHEIERLVAVEEDPARVRVVTSDRALIAKVTGLGGQVVPANNFRSYLK